MKVGTPVKISGGTHKGKKGTVGSNRATNGHQRGKIPVVVGAKNDLYWVSPDWVCENFPPKESQPPATTHDKWGQACFVDPQLPTTIFDEACPHLASVGLAQFPEHVKTVESLPTVGDYVTDGTRQGLVQSESKGIYTIVWADGDELQCTIDDLKEFQICGRQLELSDSLKESVDFAEQPNSLEDLNGSNPSNSTTTQYKSSEITLITTSSTETSEAITPIQIVPTSTPLGSPAPEPATPEVAPDLTTQNQISGSKLCDAFAYVDPRSSLLKTLKELSIEDYEQSLGDSEWQDISGTIRKSYQAWELELRKEGIEFLLLPTITACDGTDNSRPSGLIRSEMWLRKKKVIASSQYLSAPAMAAFSGFPPIWTGCLSALNQGCVDESAVATFTDALLSPNKPRSHSTESNTSTTCLPGKQWLDPSLIILKEGTQTRDVDALYETDTRTVQQYAEMMAEDLWEWEREPLPTPFLSESGKIYASDCHHRASAAILASKKIYVDLRPGELIDAILHSCKSNTAHGLPLRPKDQRKRIELFLDALSKLDETRSHELHSSVPNLTEIERRNGNWSARVIAKYLKLTESGYRTIINIMSEREMLEKFSHYSIGDWIYPTHWGNGEVAEIRYFDKRRGVFVVPPFGSVKQAEWVHPDSLQLAEKPPIPATPVVEEQKTAFSSVKQELDLQAKQLGIPANGLPECDRNEGDPQALQDALLVGVSPSKTAKTIVESLTLSVHELTDDQITQIYRAIKPRVTELGLFFL